MTVTSRLRTVIAVTALAIGMTLTVAPSAGADNYNLTPTGSMIFYNGLNYSGSSWSDSGAGSGILPSGYINQSKSVKNLRYSGTYSGMDLYYSQGGGSSAAHGCIGWGTGWNDLRNKSFNLGSGSGLFSSMYNNIARFHYHTNGC